jgi:hypothetical protein
VLPEVGEDRIAIKKGTDEPKNHRESHRLARKRDQNAKSDSDWQTISHLSYLIKTICGIDF